MAIITSAGVQTEIVDNSLIIPSEISNLSFYAGDFSKGPVDTPVIISSPAELKSIFGKPISKNQINDWYQVYNYLQYGQSLYVVRSAKDTLNATSDNTQISIKNNDDFNDQFDSIVLAEDSDIKILAKTPGTWGNNLTVTLISKEEFNNNVELYNGVFAKNLFNYIRDDQYIISVFENGIHRESIVFDMDLNSKEYILSVNNISKFIYVKLNHDKFTQTDGSGLWDGNIEYYDGNAGYYDGNPVGV